MNKNFYVAIMAGGVGSRFWPASLENKPKQFLDILGTGRTMLQLTFDRFKKIMPVENILIVTNDNYTDLVKEQLPEILADRILSEPSRNNTAPSVAYTALKIQSINPQAVFVVASSDHSIRKEAVFLEKIQQSLNFCAHNDAIMTLGIQPTNANTGYGYINFEHTDKVDGICKVKTFTEKPDKTTAQKFLDSKEYLWNAGIFIWSVSSLLKSFKQNAPEILDILTPNDDSVWKTIDTEKAFIQSNYPKTPNISVDYAILEKAKNVFTLPCDCGWSDVGTWNSLFDEAEKNAENNVVQNNKSHLINTHNCIVRAPENKKVVIKGLENFVVVDENGVLLIYPKSDEQEIKQISILMNK